MLKIAVLLLLLTNLVLLWKVIRQTRRKTGAAPLQFDQPFFVERKDMEDCLHALHGRPLKLVVAGLFNRPGVEEVDWVSPKWAFQTGENGMTKPAFTTPKDIFQFSVADERSGQDWHYHEYVFEFYVSEAPMRLEYRLLHSSEVHTVELLEGVLMVPPMLPHKVKLSGVTYVFQSTLKDGGGIDGDKKFVEAPRSDLEKEPIPT